MDRASIREDHHYEANESDEEMLADDSNADVGFLTKCKLLYFNFVNCFEICKII